MSFSRRVFMKAAIALVVLFGAACASSPDAELTGPPTVVDSCAVTRPAFGVATAAERELFAYDVDAPLNLQKTVESTNDGVEVSRISFDSPDGGRATGLLFDPVTRSSLRPGIVLMHGLPGNARNMSGLGQALAQFGAVAIAIDAPFARRGAEDILFTPQDSVEQVQLIKDLQRAVDVLRAQPNVDDERIAYQGVSYGGAMGALFVGIERRIKTAVLVVGDGGLVTHHTGPEDVSYMVANVPCAARNAWVRAMTPIEPIRFISHATIPLLLQNGRSDNFVPPADAELLHAAAPEPKAVQWYMAGHGLNQQALFARHNWLVEQIGLDPL
jgi:dienelactone hydrolase